MEQQAPITKSLYRLCVENPRFFVQPIFWTSKHLQVLHCHFKHFDSSSAPPPFPLPPAPPSASHGGPDLTQDLIHSILNAQYAHTKFASFGQLMHPYGVISCLRRTPFFYNGLWLHMPTCKVFESDDVHKFEQKPVIGCFHYDTRLFATKASDKTHAHVFRADIPSKILHALDNPTEDMDNLVWPAIQHIQVPFEPHATFSERVAGQLLAGLKTRAPEETPRGEKEGR
ncbi:hypothetical protein LB506_011507 [Fusarium annulatum]|nr:hypothetical protein LB506_011507 [Fusarium annulatum]